MSAYHSASTSFRQHIISPAHNSASTLPAWGDMFGFSLSLPTHQ